MYVFIIGTLYWIMVNFTFKDLRIWEAYPIVSFLLNKFSFMVQVNLSILLEFQVQKKYSLGMIWPKWFATPLQEHPPTDSIEGNVVCAEIEVVAGSGPVPCGNIKYGCTEIVDYSKKRDHEDACPYAPCPCPLQNCKFVNSSKQLSSHFSSKHCDSGRHFQYDCPLPISLSKKETFLVLQAEKDGVLFLLSKGTQSIGHTIVITCIGPSSSKECFLYDVVAEKGSSSLKFKSSAHSFPGRFQGLPPVDFLLVPFAHLDSSGQLDLEICIWSPTEPGSEWAL